MTRDDKTGKWLRVYEDENIVNHKFGNWFVVGIGEPDPQGGKRYVCRCEVLKESGEKCGHLSAIGAHRLTKGKTSSCHPCALRALKEKDVEYRVIEINWAPRTNSELKVFTLSRLESARLWNMLIERHRRIRRLHWTWPTRNRLSKWAQGKFPNLQSQSVQQIIGEFLEAVNSATEGRSKQKRDQVEIKARYPYHMARYRDVTYTNQSAAIKDKVLRLPNGAAGELRIPVPKSVKLPGRLMEVVLCYSKAILICELPEKEDKTLIARDYIGVDQGVNSILAACNKEHGLILNGRACKSIIQWRNKQLASLKSLQSRYTKYSRHWKRIQRRIHKMLNKASQKIADLLHKASHQVAETFPGAKAFVGKAFNGAATKLRRVQAQQVSQACNGQMFKLLGYKLNGGAEHTHERWSSKTCPKCDTRNQCKGRIYRCKKCGFTAPRDLVGSVNIRSIGLEGTMLPGRPIHSDVRFRYPVDLKGCTKEPKHKWKRQPRSKYPGNSQVVLTGTQQVAGRETEPKKLVSRLEFTASTA